jgi:Integrase core domain
MGVRFLLRPNNPVSDAPCFFCNPAREPGNPARCGNAISDGRVGSPANSGMLRLGSMPPQFLIHDRDSRYGATFDRRLRGLGIKQVRTPFRAPRANAISERWVKSVRTECLDHLLVFSEAHLRRAISRYAAYFNYWRPHRSLGQRSPCESSVHQFRPRGANCKITAEPVLGGLHHIYRRAA